MISICVPTKNEELNLPECLSSIGNAFDDVVVVDSDSTDSTVTIAKDFGATVVNFRWNGEFPKKRNWILENHTFRYPWVLFLDADERLTPDVISEIKHKIPNSDCAGYRLRFTNWFMGQPLRHGDQFRKIALFQPTAGCYERFPEKSWSSCDMEVHEHPVLDGKIGEISAKLEHHDFRGIKHYIKKHNEYSSWEAERFAWLKNNIEHWKDLNKRQAFKYKYLSDFWLPTFYFTVSYFLKGGFLDGRAGWTFARMKKRYFEEIRLKILESKN